MHERGEFGAVVLVRDVRVGPQHHCQPLASAARAAPKRDELLDVAGNLAFVPGEACAAACRACGDECERHAQHHEHCRVCAESCRRCEEGCNRLLQALPA